MRTFRRSLRCLTNSTGTFFNLAFRAWENGYESVASKWGLKTAEGELEAVYPPTAPAADLSDLLDSPSSFLVGALLFCSCCGRVEADAQATSSSTALNSTTPITCPARLTPRQVAPSPYTSTVSTLYPLTSSQRTRSSALFTPARSRSSWAPTSYGLEMRRAMMQRRRGRWRNGGSPMR